MVNATNKTGRKMDTVIVLALAALAGAGSWDATLSANVHELSGYTVIVRASQLTVVSPIGTRKDVAL